MHSLSCSCLIIDELIDVVVLTHFQNEYRPVDDRSYSSLIVARSSHLEGLRISCIVGIKIFVARFWIFSLVPPFNRVVTMTGDCRVSFGEVVNPIYYRVNTAAMITMIK